MNNTLQDFQGASSAAAAKAMKSELSKLSSQIENEEERKVSKKMKNVKKKDIKYVLQFFTQEMDGFYMLFTRYLDEKAKGKKL